MDLLKSIAVATSGLRSQSGRMRVIAENVANADSGPERAGADPYRRKIPTFQRRFDRELEAQVVDMGRVQRDQSAFRVKYEPGNPTADAAGNVKMPNVNSLIETMDMREAQRSYEANLNLISSTRRMIQRTIDILRA
ncbi:MAG: flagellar basal body rod protein FlgC [Bosea sp. (in: a-proteobacteria)]|jgi:flagellar basal-body rod protein FlgC|uniref:flagellar basal body rod protein FlgC n=1 Tax=unclassified Bosea (in: a-proteobacteria) TaxID=2653178 RepID=UPI00083CABA6|nr:MULTISPECIES: flagellar basal body rod protein FlgC [unclassified Bosea (in: a-proteobacteria)]MBA4270672.1 flagellar basal body rod protein FlgC [Methylobacterium sp.]MBX9874303.1 flagellar basal body rod protein FlgC [Beijerinckiaceae bacterium]AOG04248.1 flagellar basal-body rod protein FlgC [Bosea sp. RAC05]MBA4333671.1 flagellar basal body rod protein FlgC [Methylobacterium sp.]MCZ8042339.1 flagellar basal body rod protein FlgC [Beijerinckiaceae bacterium]|eukprot:gene674-872_t